MSAAWTMFYNRKYRSPRSEPVLESDPGSSLRGSDRSRHDNGGSRREDQDPHRHSPSHRTLRAVDRFHMHDWIKLVLLAVIDIGLNVIDPYYRFVGSDMMTDLRYSMKSNTVPFWAVPFIAIIGGFYFYCLLFSVLITAVLMDAIKDAVGRPHPDFFWLCFPDGIPHYDNVTTSVICHGEKSLIKEGHKSFPSGHSSFTKCP